MGTPKVTPHRGTVKGIANSLGWPRPRTSPKRRHGQKQKRITGAQLFNLVRRIAGVGAALMYITITLQAASITIDVLQNTENPTESFGTMEAKVIADYLGDGLIADSLLVRDVLGGDTTPRTQTLFLESATTTSFEKCSEPELFNADIYSEDFLRPGFQGLQLSGSYNITILAEVELVVVIVDCTLTPLVENDESLLQVYNLVRRKDDPSDVMLVTVSLSVQNYIIPEQHRIGPVIVASVSAVSDMRATSVEQFFVLGLDYPFTWPPNFQVYTLDGISATGYNEFTSVSKSPETEPLKHVHTTRRRGFYLNAASEQANIRNLFWKLEKESPRLAITHWNWEGKPLIVDSWAWVHGIHMLFAWQTFFALGVLGLLVFRNLRAGKIWVGDAFAAVSNHTLMVRGVLVFGSWYVNEYWTLVEFCLSNANDILDTQRIPIHPELAHADLLVMFLSVVGLIGRLTHERIDPAFALFIFEIIHSNRQGVIRSASAVMNKVVEYAYSEYRLGIVSVSALQSLKSPMRLWTSHKLEGIDFQFLLASFFPKFLLLLIILCYVVLRKIYTHYFPNSTRAATSSHATADRSTNERAELAQKGNLTNFELSTGAELQSRYGLISDYRNYVFFKGLKFASADGVYCSGYVIANGKFLVAMEDLMSIAVIKALHMRFKNVYVYEVDGSSVQRTARLVYPNTLAWRDLFRLSINVLS